MRTLTRLVTALIAASLLSLAPIGLAASAQGADTGADSLRSSTVTPQADPEITAKIVKKGKRKLIFKGRVKGVDTKKVTIYKATKCNEQTGKCNFKKHKKVKAKTKKQKWQIRVGAPKKGNWYWQARAKGLESQIWRTYTI